ncbi:uncharacterized protein J7T54_007164 [Emericellopsis cladophorae]|uniref:Siroheme synthase n=1 Tax=Emericellopsis cladophorae TaxID=2686198 RepID=A0A9P9Y8Q3_9HYPO|nr:uncharacterized protein J7T54_007164 [Emericellopsis cladophorae]KAI6785521.1 hypothetical protein J7T54_007164 [Emericellopsis cladophorae]
MSRRRTPRDSNASTVFTDIETEDPIPSFFNHSFSTYRVSPLHVGDEPLTEARLGALSRRLRDVLVGDVVRGVHIGLESSATAAGAQVGVLKAVRVRLFRAEDVFGTGVQDSEDVGSAWAALSDEQKRGLWISVQYENTSYHALLLPTIQQQDKATPQAWQMQPGNSRLRGKQSASRDDIFLHLPLMLFRMPLALRNIISDWLSTTFDCRVSKLALGTRTLVTVWEEWIDAIGIAARGSDFVITLAFNAPLADPSRAADNDDEEDEGPQSYKSGLRSIDITMQPQDLRRFVRAGKAIAEPRAKTGASWETDHRERRRLAGNDSDNGWAWLLSGQATEQQPFTNALARYLDHHLALNLFHPSVRVVQIAANGYVLASSRLKIVSKDAPNSSLSKATWMFITTIGQRISGEALPAIFT